MDFRVKTGQQIPEMTDDFVDLRYLKGILNFMKK